MKTARREQRIIDFLESRGAMSVEELSGLLGVSVSTLRKQLAVMQENGLVIRTYGGVMPVNRVPDESFESKLHKNIAEKRRIAERARSLIPAGATVALGSGTSIYGLANLLDDLTKGTVYTNSLQTADYLARCPGLEVHISSGILRSRTGTITGSEAAEYFRSIRQVDYAFIGCDAIDGGGVVFSDNLAVASVEKIILNCARHKYILCDGSKLGQSAVARVVELRDCDGLITLRSDTAEEYESMTTILYA
ncbi:MAG: DeoR/GlpR transcriptional regulator [Oscillospiraceae bacterium]|nr:DeoR/GlpR transcriptional regulator [Oscillospiraceae bacterium]